MTTVKRSWNDITIADYDRLVEISEGGGSPIEIDVKTLAVLCDCEEEKIWDLPLDRMAILRNEMNWLTYFDFPKKLRTTKLKICGEDFNVMTDVSKFTVAQYVDFQTLWKDRDKHKAEVMCLFIVPRGKKYNDGYDVGELAEILKKTISIVDYNTICFFFLKELRLSTAASLTFSIWTMERMMKKEKDPEMKKKIAKEIEILREKRSSFGFAL